MKKALSYVFIGLILLFAVSFAVAGYNNGYNGNYYFSALLIVLSGLWFCLSRKKNAGEEKPEVIKDTARSLEHAQPKYTYFTFRVAGTTFKNADGSDRQKILRHIKFRDEPYAEEGTRLYAEIKETTFNGETAFIVLVNDYQIGFVPKKSILDVVDAFSGKDFSITAIDVVGGGRDKETGERLSYGCEITGRYIKNV